MKKVFLVGFNHKNNPVLQELLEHEGYTQFGLNKLYQKKNGLLSRAGVEIVDGEIKYLNKSEGSIHDFSEGDIILVLEQNESDQFFAT